MRGIFALTLAAGLCLAQDDPSLSAHFEVVSVKPVPPGTGLGFYGGPGSSDPERVHYAAASVRDLISDALHVGREVISGPAWLDSRYEVDAKIPPGATLTQYRGMLANLLTERFGLMYHRVPKDVTGYELIIVPGGPRDTLKPSLSSAPSKPQPFLAETKLSDGFAHMTFHGATMGLVANRIAAAFNGAGGVSPEMPVVNKTGLDGKYDLTIDLPTNEASYLPNSMHRQQVDPETASAVLEKQFGLKLRPVKMSVDFIIVDHVAKIPSEN